MAIVIALRLSIDQQQKILRKYGYCLSDSIAADMTTKWFINNYPNAGGREILLSINEVLEKMGLPLLMTRII